MHSKTLINLLYLVHAMLYMLAKSMAEMSSSIRLALPPLPAGATKKGPVSRNPLFCEIIITYINYIAFV